MATVVVLQGSRIPRTLSTGEFLTRSRVADSSGDVRCPDTPSGACPAHQFADEDHRFIAGGPLLVSRFPFAASAAFPAERTQLRDARNAPVEPAWLDECRVSRSCCQAEHGLCRARRGFSQNRRYGLERGQVDAQLAACGA